MNSVVGFRVLAARSGEARGAACRIQNDIRVGQGAGRNPLLYGFYARLQQAKAPDPESPTWMRFAITERISLYRHAISQR